MQSESNKNSKESSPNKEEYPHVPYQGFVNVNDIVEKRRRLRNAEFNVSDDSWDKDLNVQHKENPDQD